MRPRRRQSYRRMMIRRCSPSLSGGRNCARLRDQQAVGVVRRAAIDPEPDSDVQPRLVPKYLIFGSCVARARLRAVPRTAGNLEL